MSLFDNLKVLKGNNHPPSPPSTADSAVKVLIVDDEKTLADALEIKMKQSGFTALQAQNGQAALDLLVSEKPNVMLLDLLMPVMDGKTVLRKINDMPDFKSLPVIVLTNAGSVDNMADMKYFDNVKDFLVKSNFDLEEIVAKIKALT